jgi:hypothetical protein
VAFDYSTPECTQELEDKVGEAAYEITVAMPASFWRVNTLSDADHFEVRKATAANLEAHKNLFSILAAKTKRSYMMVDGAAVLGLPQLSLTGIMANAVVAVAKVAYYELKNNKDLPDLTNVLLSSSVGHEKLSRANASPTGVRHRPCSHGLEKHKVDSGGTILLDNMSS